MSDPLAAFRSDQALDTRNIYRILQFSQDSPQIYYTSGIRKSLGLEPSEWNHGESELGQCGSRNPRSAKVGWPHVADLFSRSSRAAALLSLQL